jgi:hypothetical protein
MENVAAYSINYGEQRFVIGGTVVAYTREFLVF